MGSWRNSRTSSTKLLWCILPFMVVAVFIGVKKSNWVDGSKYSVVKDDVAVVAVAPAVVGGGGEVAEPPVEGFQSYNSSYPPLGMEDEMDVELPVSHFLFFFFFFFENL
ncbi:hypothetical protein HanOQP8_Chr11g0425351 [Helianthus annuus]|nr:hypothetical protein HanLR1_Chr11g0424621 [Helianthus annuus]KAJ0691101.1 hypothetical protein HanOQP8_Chr11g0425351 [Helianthus annuus]